MHFKSIEDAESTLFTKPKESDNMIHNKLLSRNVLLIYESHDLTTYTRGVWEFL